MNGFEDVKDFLQRTFNQDLAEKTEFLANNRKFRCFGCSDKALWLSFKDFFSSPCASKDFIEIVKTFEWVFISNFHACNDDDIDKIRRFISFIDIAYQEKQKLKCFYDPNSMINLKNTKLDFVAIDGKDKQFIFINPNDPEYQKPDESLDSNTTHDFH